MKKGKKQTASKDKNNVAYKKNKIISGDIQKIIKLSDEYIKKFLKINNVKTKKINHVLKKKYEFACEMRNKELGLLHEAEGIFKKINVLRKKINKRSRLAFGNPKFVFYEIEK